jgi:uncharacterized C2H2 Zn-finger protein
MFASEDHIQESTRVKHTAKAGGNALNVEWQQFTTRTLCLKCFQPFKCFALMIKHFKVCKLPFECDVCDKIFKLESNLLDHFNSAHRKSSKYVWLLVRGSTKIPHTNVAFAGLIYFSHEGFYNSHFKNIHKADHGKKVAYHFFGKIFRSKNFMVPHLLKAHRMKLKR